MHGELLKLLRRWFDGSLRRGSSGELFQVRSLNCERQDRLNVSAGSDGGNQYFHVGVD